MLRTFRVIYVAFDEEGNKSVHNMTIGAVDESDVERKFNYNWGLEDVHIIKIEEL